LDHAPHEELAANYFKATQAEAKLRREGITGQRNAEQAHREVGEAVRKTIIDLGNTPPENLPAEEHIRHVEKRVKAAGKALSAPSVPKGKPKK
jgi:DNA-damage-inducible protein D